MTFKALAGVATPYLQQWIAQTPPTEQAVINDGPAIGAFATDAGQLFADLKPGVAALTQSAPALTAAFRAGTANLPATAEFDKQTVALAKALDQFGADSTVQSGLSRLTLASNSLAKPLQSLTPAQNTCNYVTLFLRNLASALSDNVGTGTVLRVVLVAIDNDIGGGEGEPSATPYTSNSTSGGTQHGPLHFDPYPEHRRRRSACRMLGRQGAVLAKRGGDRQPDEERRHRHREDNGERQMTDSARRRPVRRRQTARLEPHGWRDRDRRDRRRLLPRVRRRAAVRGAPHTCCEPCSRPIPTCTSRRRSGSPASRLAR